MEIEKAANGNGNGKCVSVPARRSRGRPKNPGTKVHISLPESLTERLHAVQLATHAGSLTEVVKSALLLYAAAVEEHQSGGHLYFRREHEGAERQLALFL
jgi:hypothetical protein